jgi:hypothetical protein
MNDSGPDRDAGEDRPPVFEVSFADGSRFALPREWEDVFADSFGFNPAVRPEVEARLRFLVAKYEEHRAWPSKFDGIGVDDETDARYDNPDFYWERWDDRQGADRLWVGLPPGTPTSAEVAEAVMYQEMRPGLLQKALQAMAEETGRPAPRVLTPEQFLRELDDREGS